MPVHNKDIKEIFNQTADLLEIEGANQFRIRAYRDAARTIGGLSENVESLMKEKDLSSLSGIGKDLANKIETIVKTGSLPLLEDLKKRTSPELSDMMKLPGLGPKKVKAIYEELGIKTREALEKAAENHEIRNLEGFGEKTEENILEALEKGRGDEERTRLMEAEEMAEAYVDYLKKKEGVKDIQVAGSYRRRKETVGDLDILITHKRDVDIMSHFADYEDVEKIVSKGSTRSTVILRSGLQVDLRAVPQVSYGSALHYFTGSKEHNIAVRKIGVKKGLKINEYGVYRDDERIAGKSEEEVYEQVGLPYIEPELRENRGEIEAARNDELPELLTLDDIKGDLHSHSNWTDGHYRIREMAEAAKKMGYEYMANTEHSQQVSVAGGLSPDEMAKVIEEVDEVNKKMKDFTVLKGIEVDILEDGSLDMPDEILEQLDVVVCSVHYKMKMTRKKMTARIIKAMENPNFNILGHPTGRMINEREPYDVDLQEVMKAAKDNGCFLELNAYPDRLDLKDNHCRQAKDMGVRISIATDSHSTDNLNFMRFGIYQARRGWLEPDDVINARSLKDLRKLLKRK